ncbi:hypothetical protein [Kitasatospora sp. NBC_01300]|uniref:hypothetical protein n=1 Tax=Kitasatospora sp. NBC_01300 TaxID=2903574 RepID=UPI002F910D84|nr:hypothetical protein OG556_40060 [Kitasatospora sp. NBC_01300]
MDRQTFTAKLTELRALRDRIKEAQSDLTAAEKVLAAKKEKFDALDRQRARAVAELAGYEGAKGDTVAKAGGLKLADVVRIAPLLDPTPAALRDSPAETRPEPDAPEQTSTPATEPVAPGPAAAETASADAVTDESAASAVPTEDRVPAEQTPVPAQHQVRVLPSIPQGPAGERYTALTEGLHNKRPTWEQNWYETVWLDAKTGDLATQSHVGRVDLGARTPGDILDAVTSVVPGVQRIYITAGDPWHLSSQRYPTLKEAVAAWLNTPGPRWTESRGRGANRDQFASHLVHPRNPVGRYIPSGAERDARQVEIHSVGPWFTPDGADVALVRHAFWLIYEALQRQWPDVVMMAFPSAMGRDLWKRTIPTSGQFAGGFPVMSEELRALMHATAGQGRTELIVPPRVPGTLQGLYEADRTFAYGRHTHRSGVGAPQRITPRMFEAMDAKQRRKALKDPSHWHIRATVPQDWNHVGILPAPVPGDRAWEYPANPGTTFTTWAGGNEVFLAMMENPQKTPWRIEILDGLVWKEGDPLDKWAVGLKSAWSDLVGLSRVHGDERTRRAAHLASRGIRSILLYGIGDFARRPRVNTGTTPIDQPVPDGAMIIGQDEHVTTWERVTSLARDPWAHPEWAAGVWSDARAALLDMSIRDGKTAVGQAGALHLPPGSVVALRTDAVYSTEPIRWPYFGKPGEYLLKGYQPGPVDAPTTEDRLLELRDLGRTHFATTAAALDVADAARRGDGDALDRMHQAWNTPLEGSNR